MWVPAIWCIANICNNLGAIHLESSISRIKNDKSIWVRRPGLNIRVIVKLFRSVQKKLCTYLYNESLRAWFPIELNRMLYAVIFRNFFFIQIKPVSPLVQYPSRMRRPFTDSSSLPEHCLSIFVFLPQPVGVKFFCKSFAGRNKFYVKFFRACKIASFACTYMLIIKFVSCIEKYFITCMYLLARRISHVYDLPPFLARFLSSRIF